MAQSYVLSQLKPMKQTIFTCSRKYLCLNKLPSTYSNPKQSIDLNQLNDKGHFGVSVFVDWNIDVEACMLLTNGKICCNGK